MKRLLLPGIVICVMALAGCGGAQAKAKLEGSAWQLVSLAGAPVVEGSTVTINFEEGNVGGSAGCNRYGGEYRVKGDALEIEALMTTLMACADDAVTQQEGAYLAALGGACRYSLEETELRILCAEGTELVFSRRNE
jgi:heat shock protein HslJ